MKLSARDRRAIVLGGAALGVILLLYFVVVPWLDSWADARRRIATFRGELQSRQSQIERLLRMRGRLEQMYGRAANRPPETIEAVRIAFPKAVSEICKAGGIQLRSTTPRSHRQPRDMPGLELVSLQVKGKCQLSQLAKCLAEGRKAETLVIVERLTITGGQKKPGELDVTMDLETLARQQRSG